MHHRRMRLRGWAHGAGGDKHSHDLLLRHLGRRRQELVELGAGPRLRRRRALAEEFAQVRVDFEVPTGSTIHKLDSSWCHGPAQERQIAVQQCLAHQRRAEGGPLAGNGIGRVDALMHLVQDELISPGHDDAAVLVLVQCLLFGLVAAIHDEDLNLLMVQLGAEFDLDGSRQCRGNYMRSAGRRRVDFVVCFVLPDAQELVGLYGELSQAHPQRGAELRLVEAT
mmetsp:Transcript_81776/g.210607  ORF Transcript_81776/g.210607 Transcript_81776/m.210607 type:complete len:224 (-) Transcript_81776:296-967(-)